MSTPSQLEIEPDQRQILSSERHEPLLFESSTITTPTGTCRRSTGFSPRQIHQTGTLFVPQQETTALYRQSYNFALKAAKAAQQAFWYERGDTRRDFLQDISWNSLQEGLMAGERLELALHSMDQAYIDLNCREFELQNFSLRVHFPLAFLELRLADHVRSRSRNGCSTLIILHTTCAA